MPNVYTPDLIAELNRLTDGLPRAEGVKAVGKRLKLSERAARTAYARFINPSAAAPQQPTMTKKTMADKMETEYKTLDVQELSDVVKACKVDEKTWRVKSFAVSQNKSGAFVWRTSFERNKHMNQAFIDELKEDLKAVVVAPPKTKTPTIKGGRLLEVSLFDAHFGKLGWAEQDGADYDLKIARKIFFEAIHELIDKAKKQGPISRVLFPVGNDYLTIDSDKNETTAGTAQDVDSRFAKIYREGRKMLVEAIEVLRQIAPVDVVVIAGNHDNQSMFHLGDALECWFHTHTDVKVFNAPISRKYYQFGKVMLCFCHGHLEKHAQLPTLAAVEEPQMWAATTYREWHTAHFHHEVLNEHMGVNVRILSSLSGPDRYHHDHGYVGAKRMAQAFLFNEETGLEAIFNSTPVRA